MPIAEAPVELKLMVTFVADPEVGVALGIDGSCVGCIGCIDGVGVVVDGVVLVGGVVVGGGGDGVVDGGGGGGGVVDGGGGGGGGGVVVDGGGGGGGGGGTLFGSVRSPTGFNLKSPFFI